ncbi:MAG: phosphotransferase [Anaerolineae bacterium]|nr:phosphotransferase [Anaerolineae bacterium]
MHRHPYFDLWLHDDDELAAFVESDVSERVTLHEWPLSCVQRLALADGRRLIYKTQFGPTVESEFYARARSEILPWAKTIYEADGHVCMLVEFVAGPRAEELGLGEEQAIRISREVVAQIAAIEGDLPHYLDIGDGEKWRALVYAMLRDLEGLIERNAFEVVDEAMMHHLEERAFSKPVLEVFRTSPGYVHHDLGGDNLLVLPDGYRVIDWQRPILGPTDLDVATLLRSLGVDPLPHVGEGIVRMLDLLTVHWFAQAATRWFPAGIADYDVQIAELTRGNEEK